MPSRMALRPCAWDMARMHRHRPVPALPRAPQPTPLAFRPLIHTEGTGGGGAAGAAPGHGMGDAWGLSTPLQPPQLGQAATGSGPTAPSSRSRHPARR